MNISILVVDDHELFRKGLIHLLGKQKDFRIIGEADDGKSAIELAFELQPDVIVLDVQMPEMDGIETTRQILDANPDVKILALSIHDERDYVEAMITAGASGYILKDSAVEELIVAIRKVVTGHRYLSPDLVDVVLESLSESVSEPPKSMISRLSPRESEILRLIAEGLSSKEIAFDLKLSTKTVDAHRQKLMKKLEIYNVADLTKLAIKEGLIKI